jgi:hypothetical protein
MLSCGEIMSESVKQEWIKIDDGNVASSSRLQWLWPQLQSWFNPENIVRYVLCIFFSSL